MPEISAFSRTRVGRDLRVPSCITVRLHIDKVPPPCTYTTLLIADPELESSFPILSLVLM